MNSIHLHPNKINPKRWRVQDKVYKKQAYFSFARFGSKEKAYAAALEFAHELKHKRKFRDMRMSLDYNKLFDEYGFVRGLIFVKNKGDVYLRVQLTKDGKQIGKQKSLNALSLYQAFSELTKWLIDVKCIENTLEIKAGLKNAYKLTRTKQCFYMQTKDR